MAIAAVQVKFERTTQIPEDAVVNTMHFFCDGTRTSLAQANEIADKVVAFYNGAGGAGSVANLISTVISRVSLRHHILVYDLSDPMPRQPILDRAWTLGAGTSGNLPSEVAVVLSLKGVTPIGSNPARHRGRLYIGPLSSFASGPLLNGDIRPTSSVQTSLVNAAVAMMDQPADTVAWSIYSTVNNALSRVIECFVDDAFDTQRRRGAKATSRVVGFLSQV
jgi:hypothetical protein